MRVDNIKALIWEFKDFKKANKAPSIFWEMTEIFSKNWNLSQEFSELPSMFNKAIQSSQDRSIWKRPRYYPKNMMVLFFQNYPEYCKQAFSELFTPKLDLEVRIDRFKFYSDQLLELYKKDYPVSTENNHYQDTEIIGCYLFLYDPLAYPLYKFEWLKTICEFTEAKPIPENHDIGRFFKISKILRKFLQQESALIEVYESETSGTKLNFCKPMETYVPLADFYTYCGRKHNLPKNEFC